MPVDANLWRYKAIMPLPWCLGALVNKSQFLPIAPWKRAAQHPGSSASIAFPTTAWRDTHWTWVCPYSIAWWQVRSSHLRELAVRTHWYPHTGKDLQLLTHFTPQILLKGKHVLSVNLFLVLTGSNSFPDQLSWEIKKKKKIIIEMRPVPAGELA